MGAIFWKIIQFWTKSTESYMELNPLRYENIENNLVLSFAKCIGDPSKIALVKRRIKKGLTL